MSSGRHTFWSKFSFALVTLFLFPQISIAQDLSIFDSRRPISMSSDEKTYRDFYINGGIEHGIKKNMILTVQRRLTLYDSYRANTPIEIMVDVGRIKIIHTQKGLSVAREYSKFSRKAMTTLENDFVMVGDKIDMASALMETQMKKKSASMKPRKKQQSMEEDPKQMSQADFSSMAPVYGPERPPVEMSTLQ